MELTIQEEQAIKEYVKFKISQYVRITGFDYRQENAREKLGQQIKPLLRGFVEEALQRA